MTDIVERFQLSLLLIVIVLRNLFEVSGSMFSTLPTSYININVLPSFSVFHRIFTPAIIVLVSEMLVDWLKHAFINKFNHIRPAVYGRFIDVLSKDLITNSSSANGRRVRIHNSAHRALKQLRNCFCSHWSISLPLCLVDSVLLRYRLLASSSAFSFRF